MPFATAYVQNSAAVAAGASSLTVSARLLEKPSTMSPPGDWDFRLLVRRAGPVSYSLDEDGVATATYDELAAPALEPGDADAGAPDVATWTIDDLSAGGTVYFQFVNLGTTEGILSQIAVE